MSQGMSVIFGIFRKPRAVNEWRICEMGQMERTCDLRQGTWTICQRHSSHYLGSVEMRRERKVYAPWHWGRGVNQALYDGRQSDVLRSVQFAATCVTRNGMKRKEKGDVLQDDEGLLMICSQSQDAPQVVGHQRASSTQDLERTMNELRIPYDSAMTRA